VSDDCDRIIDDIKRILNRGTWEDFIKKQLEDFLKDD